MNVPSYWHIWKPINASAAMWYVSCALRRACTYIAATQQGVADICLYQLQCTCKCICIILYSLPVSTFSYYIAIDMYNKTTCVCSKHDDEDDKMSILAFTILYLSKFSQLWFIKIFDCLNFMSYGTLFTAMYITSIASMYVRMYIMH